MKMYSCMVLLFGCKIIVVSSQTYQLSSSCGGTVQTGGSCTLTCETSLSALSWNDGSTSFIQERVSCSSLSPSISDYTSACPTSTTYTISFTNARYDRDSRTWKCQSPFGGSSGNEIQVDVTVPLTSVTLTRTSISITCDAVSNPRPTITLYRDGVSVSTSPPAADGSNGWTATLNYQLTGDSRNYVYWCQTSNAQTSVNSTFSFPQISVTSVALRNISANSQEVGAAEGQSLTLTCVTSASYPAASVTWYKNNAEATSGLTGSTEVTSGVATVTTSVVTFDPLTKSDLGHRVYCSATNQHTSSPVLSNTARVGVWYGPHQADITHSDNIPTIENRDLTLTCTVTANPVPTFSWDYSDGTSAGGSTGSVIPVTGSTSSWAQTLTFRPNRNKLTVRCVTRNTKTSKTRTATETLDVKYPPPGSPVTTRFPFTMFEGDQETITCSVTGGNPLGTITWTCPGTGTPDVSTSGKTRTSTLTFTVTRGQNGQQCRCQGSWQYGGYTQSVVRTFSVSYPPTKPTLTVPSIVCDGRPVSPLGCSSSDTGNPTATYTWTKNGNSVSFGFTPVRADNGATIRCSAGNIFTNRPGFAAAQSDSKIITVHYLPRITIQSAPTTPLKEGDSLSMTCASDSNPSTTDSEINWVFGGTETLGPRLQKSDLNRRDHGAYTCIAIVNSTKCETLQGSKNVAVVVNYAPDVTLSDVPITEGQPLTLTCQAEGRPATYNFRSYTQYWGDTEIQTHVGQQSSDTYTLRIDTVSYLDSGVYECSVDNTVTDRNGVLIQRRKVNVTVRARPKFTTDSRSLYAGEIGNSVTLHQSVYSKHNCTYNWTFSGKITDKQSAGISASQVTLDVYGRVVQDDGWKFTLTISGFQEKDKGLYTVVVCNIVGCNASSVNLTMAGPPWVPLDFKVTNVTQTSVLLKWKPNFPGGDFTQVFLLHYRKTEKSEWTSIEKGDNPFEYVYADVTGLDPGTVYEFRVRARSSRAKDNEGAFTDTITAHTLAVTPEESNQTGVIVGSVIAMLVVGLIVISAVVMYRKGYRCTVFERGNGTENKRNEEPADVDNATYSSIDHIASVPTNTYSSLENTESQQYTQLSLYENSRVEPARNSDDHTTYEDLQERQHEAVALHTYENSSGSNNDPAYLNTSKT